MSNSLERAFAVLELVDRNPGGLSNHDISERLRMPTSTCSYITSRLERRGYLLRDESTRRFRVGLAAVPLAHGALRELRFREVSEQVLYAIARDTGLSVGIGVLQRDRVLIVDRVEGTLLTDRACAARAREDRDTGTELPVHATALGKILLASLPHQRLASFLDGCVLAGCTRRTIVGKAELAKEIEAARQTGHATANEELCPGLRALAVPIVDALGRVRAALSINGDANASAWNDPYAPLRTVEAAARAISARACLE